MTKINTTEKQLKTLKWMGTLFLILGVTLNTLNTPQWQEIVYPHNLFISLFGSSILLLVAKLDNDMPYVALNSLVMMLYMAGVYNYVFVL